MSAALDHSKFISIEDYLLGESISEIRHEYHAGVVVAMAGAKESHEIVSGNLFTEIHRHLRGKPCRAFKSDMKVKVELHKEDYFYYPDIMVECGESNPDSVYKENPKLIIEVLSEPKRDLIEKLFAYQHIDSLEEYAVIDQDTENPRARIFRKSDNWEMSEGIITGKLELTSIEFSMLVQDLFAV